MSQMPWSPHNPNRCAVCRGIGLVVRQVQSDLYLCGFTTVAETCPACLGSGRTMPTSIDRKALAAGEAAHVS